jgi:hypothetical protein
MRILTPDDAYHYATTRSVFDAHNSDRATHMWRDPRPATEAARRAILFNIDIDIAFARMPDVVDLRVVRELVALRRWFTETELRPDYVVNPAVNLEDFA